MNIFYIEIVNNLNSKFLVLMGRERNVFYLTMHSTHFIYGYMASDIWLRTILIVRKETRCRHIGYSYRLTARVLLYAPSHRQDNTYHSLCYTSRGALAGTRNISIDPTTHHTMSERSTSELRPAHFDGMTEPWNEWSNILNPTNCWLMCNAVSDLDIGWLIILVHNILQDRSFDVRYIF